MERSDIEKELGPPDAATQEGVVYYFHRLPRGWVGGGAELDISYSSDGRCSKADWMFTQ